MSERTPLSYSLTWPCMDVVGLCVAPNSSSFSSAFLFFRSSNHRSTLVHANANMFLPLSSLISFALQFALQQWCTLELPIQRESVKDGECIPGLDIVPQQDPRRVEHDSEGSTITPPLKDMARMSLVRWRPCAIHDITLFVVFDRGLLFFRLKRL